LVLPAFLVEYTSADTLKGMFSFVKDKGRTGFVLAQGTLKGSSIHRYNPREIGRGKVFVKMV
jgi:hypothetical protein